MGTGILGEASLFQQDRHLTRREASMTESVVFTHYAELLLKGR